jgi:hypothetical protein
MCRGTAVEDAKPKPCSLDKGGLVRDTIPLAAAALLKKQICESLSSSERTSRCDPESDTVDGQDRTDCTDVRQPSDGYSNRAE